MQTWGEFFLINCTVDEGDEAQYSRYLFERAMARAFQIAQLSQTRNPWRCTPRKLRRPQEDIEDHVSPETKKKEAARAEQVRNIPLVACPHARSFTRGCDARAQFPTPSADSSPYRCPHLPSSVLVAHVHRSEPAPRAPSRSRRPRSLPPRFSSLPADGAGPGSSPGFPPWRAG